MTIDELKARLLKLDTAALCDANKRIRIMDAGIKPLRAGLKLFGVARTVSCKDDFLSVIVALSQSQKGEVLVIDCQGGSKAVAGELFSAEAARRGLGGLVVDGAVRDTLTIKTLNIPVYCRSVHPMAGMTKRLLDVQVPINCGGTKVNPGDILFGDEEGVLVGTFKEFAEIVTLAEEIQKKEQDALARMGSGESLVSMLNLEEHLRALQIGKDSTLLFE
jgi:RraA family protein